MWNYMGWDSLSTIAGEIDNPRRNFPRALAITIPLITIVYLAPTLISLAVVGPDEVEWTAGAYTVIAERLAGLLQRGLSAARFPSHLFVDRIRPRLI